MSSILLIRRALKSSSVSVAESASRLGPSHLSSSLARPVCRSPLLLASAHTYQGPNALISSAARFHTRGISFTAIPKILLRSARIPATFGSVVFAGASYVTYKVQEASNYTQDKIGQVTGFVSDSLESAKDFVDGIELPSIDFEFDLFSRSKSDKSGSDHHGTTSTNDFSDGGGDGPGSGKGAIAVGAAAVASSEDPEDDNGGFEMMHLTKQMIEIRNILQQVDQSDTLQLPSIVVIGSQSSGKSSVLEAIVGHEFLPKGSNMVTRRPIELTLVNTPDAVSEYGEFPSLGMTKITDFTQVQKILTDLNLSVPLSETISDDPIQLTIYSPNIPDLTLIDLPGYIQVESADQPIELKQKIQQVCDKYIKNPNIILAISAADVDLANSTALRASRRIDPHGERTIGVVTKMDLVDPTRAVDILTNRNYPLRMGYVGVVTKTPTNSLFRRSSNVGKLIAQNEQSYFSKFEEFKEMSVGTILLRKKLMHVLEKSMASSLQPTCDAIVQELEEATYRFKVEYNDRSLTPKAYLDGSVDAFKLAFKDFSSSFGRDEVRSLLRSELDQKVLDLLAQRYWNKPITDDNYSNGKFRLLEQPISALPSASADDVFWHRKLDAATSSLTKLGVGRLSTNLVTDALLSEMDRIVDLTAFKNHPFARSSIQEAANTILNRRFYSTADQVENCIKPYKYEIEIEDREWNSSREHSLRILKEELKQCEESFSSLKKTIGGRKLSQVMSFIETTRNRQHDNSNNGSSPREGSDAFGFSQGLLARGKEALFLRDRSDILKMRMMAIKSTQCKTKENKYFCPEIFLDSVADKLTQTAVLFLNVELLSDFYYNFPRELDNRLGSNLTNEQIEAFAKEDSKIKRHIELQQRKELLELALDKIEEVIALQKSKTRSQPGAIIKPDGPLPTSRLRSFR